MKSILMLSLLATTTAFAVNQPNESITIHAQTVTINTPQTALT